MNSVSVVISTLNRATSLRETLKSLQHQRHGLFEVVVVVGPCTDNTMDVLGDFPLAKVIHCKHANLSESRNLGIRAASGKLIFFIDDDAVADPWWIVELSTAFDDPSVDFAGGWTLNHTGIQYQFTEIQSNRLGDSGPIIQHRLIPGNFASTLGTNAAFRRSALVKFGFDEEFVYYLDETDVCLRMVDAGHVCGYVEHALVKHCFLPSEMRSDRDRIINHREIIKSKRHFVAKHAGAFTADDQRGNFEEFMDLFRRRDRPGQEEAFDAVFAAALELPVGTPRLRSERWFGAGSTFVQFKPYEPNPGLHIVLIDGDPLLAHGLAQLGHVVRMVTATTGGHIMDFDDGVWAHRVPVTHHPQQEIMPDVWDRSASFLDEVDRINDHHPVDLVQGDTADLVAFLPASRYVLIADAGGPLVVGDAFANRHLMAVHEVVLSTVEGTYSHQDPEHATVFYRQVLRELQPHM